MKLETLVKRYKNLGYTPKGLDRDLEIASIIKWIYETHDIYIDVFFCDIKFIGYEENYNKFCGYKIWNTKEDFSNKNTCDDYFVNPFDAKFDAVKGIYRALKFQRY
jgi:hypothetical protein